jgi:dihydroxyacetone kinase
MLWGVLLQAIGRTVGNTGTPTGSDLVSAVRAGIDDLRRVGKADLGDKTMLDALIPFADTFAGGVEKSTDCAAAWQQAAEIATQKAVETAALRPKVGRARPLADRSVGTPDAGATSMALCLTVAGSVLAGEK